MGHLYLAPPNPDGSAPQLTGLQVWFEPPRHGWLFPHVVGIGLFEFVCRATGAMPEEDFMLPLVNALLGVLNGEPETRAEAFGEPLSFDFRFYRDANDIGCRIVSFNKFAEVVTDEPILHMPPQGDIICRVFCWGIRELIRTVPVEDYRRNYHQPFPLDQFKTLCAKLGGEFAGELGEAKG